MSSYPETKEIGQIIGDAKTIVVVQADNPDTDSLASALALEQILGGANKTVHLYCGVDLPSYLSYLPGADGVVSEIPPKFDASIIVDTSSAALLEKLKQSGSWGWLAAKPSIVIDHHATEPTIDFAKIICNHPAVATGEVIYELATQAKWPIDQAAAELLAIAILSDSLGLTSEATTARSIHIIAELVEQGVKLAELEEARRSQLRREPELVHYKGRLLERVEFHDNDRIATLVIPWEEIEKYSPLYNPPMLVIDDMRMGKNTRIAICYKSYLDGRITGKIRCNYGSGVANKLAEHFGGGGHPYAAGFKVTDGRSLDEIKNESIRKTIELLDKLEVAK